jgi:hypothetical protein
MWDGQKRRSWATWVVVVAAAAKASRRAKASRTETENSSRFLPVEKVKELSGFREKR